jgi:hypothetical protein
VLAVVGCGGKDAPPAPSVTLTPELEAQFAALGGECKHLMRMGGEPGAAPRVFQCQSTTAYVSINTYTVGVVSSIELSLTGSPAELRASYAAALGKLVPAATLTAIQDRFPDGGAGIDPPVLVKAGGLKLMIAADKKPAGLRGDVTIVDSTLALPVIIPEDAPARRAPAFWPVVAFVVVGALVALGVWALGARDATPTFEVPPTEVVTSPSTTPPRPTVAATVAPTVAPTAAPAVVTPRTPATKAPKAPKAEKGPKAEKPEKGPKG